MRARIAWPRGTKPHDLVPPDRVYGYLNAHYGQQIRARVEDANGGIMCPHCDLEMSIVYWPPDSGAIIIAFTCDPSGHGHWLGAWDAAEEMPT